MSMEEKVANKRCTKCGETKPVAEFHRDRYRKDGYYSQCKPCVKKRDAKCRDERYRRLTAYHQSPAGKEAARKLHAKRYATEEGRLKSRVKAAVRKAISDGKLLRPEICERCGKAPERGVVQGHHSDYSKPLEVEWLCPRCHRTVHVEQLAQTEEQIREILAEEFPQITPWYDCEGYQVDPRRTAAHRIASLLHTPTEPKE